MLEPLHRFIRPGIVHFMAYPGIADDGQMLESLTTILKDCFFDVIEVSSFPNAGLRRQARELFESSGIEVRFGAYPTLLSESLNLNSLDEGIRRRSVDAMCVGIEEALEVGAAQFGLMSGSYDGEDKRAACMDSLERSLDTICAYANNRSVTVLLEPFDRSVDKKCLIGPVADAKEIAERIRREHSNFGLIVDLSHIPLLGESAPDALCPIAQFLMHVHIGNCCLAPADDAYFGDKHPRFGYKNGVNDVDELTVFLRELFNVGYLTRTGDQPRGVSFEIKPMADESTEVMVAGAKRKLRTAWNRLTLAVHSDA